MLALQIYLAQAKTFCAFTWGEAEVRGQVRRVTLMAFKIRQDTFILIFMYTSSPGYTAAGGQWPERGVSRDLPLISIRRVSKYQRKISVCVDVQVCVRVCEQSHSCVPIIWQVHSLQVYFHTEGHPRGVGRVACESSRRVTSVITSRKTETTLSSVSADVWVWFGDGNVVCLLPGCCQNWPRVK